MMRIFFGRGALVVTCLAVMASSSAHAADVLTPSLRTYDSASLAAGNLPIPKVSAASLALDLDPEGGAVTPQSWWPLMYSALVPGLGELSMGYEKRGIGLMVAEAVAWTGYFKKHNEGMDQRDEYEAFADAHWTENRWVDEFPGICQTPPTSVEDIEDCGRDTSGQGIWPGYIPYIPKDSDKQHYYENLGKYDWFISGWDDWKGLDTESLEYHMETDNRTKYRSMRQASNNSLDDADSFLWISFAARAFSLAETAIIIHNRRDDAGGGAGGGSPVSLRARPRGYTGGEVALEVRF
jgi:hypothetical protein